uniref:Uncharacterized protein n=1 Tax=Anguilla anguilla TaxID=7936 RepID=A0A0E9P8B9_ANGAN
MTELNLSTKCVSHKPTRFYLSASYGFSLTMGNKAILCCLQHTI